VTYVYFISEVGGGPIKIGYGIDPGYRLAQLQIGNHRRLEILGVVEDRDGLENRLHTRFWKSRLRGEWFERTPELVDYIAENAVCWEEVSPRDIWYEPVEAPKFSDDEVARVAAIGDRMRAALEAEASR
jgi:hypothetical protein